MQTEVQTAKAEKNKATAKKTVVTIALAILAIAAVGAAAWLSLTPPEEKRGNSATGTVTEKLESVLLSRKITSIPFMPTDIPTVFYAADAAGNVVYYEFNGTEYVEIPPTGTMEIAVQMSGQHITATVPYIERDGVLTGFGLYTSQSNADVYIYNFVMFKVCNLPTAFTQDGKCLLLAFTDQSKAYTQDPLWEEAFVLNRADGKTTRFLSENNRTLSMTGAMRSDFCMVSDTALTENTAAIPFLSARGREESAQEDSMMDIYVKNGSKEKQVVQDVIGRYIKPLGDGAFVFLRKTQGGFDTVRYENGTETVVTSFYAGYGTACLRSGDWILSKEDGRVVSTYDASKSYTLTNYKLNPLLFAVSPDEKYIVMAGTGANALDYKIYIYNTESGKSAVFTETNYAAHSNMRFIDNETVTYYVLNVDGYENIVLDVSKIK